MRVLLVDDEAAFVRPLAERLDLRGIEAGVALDAEAALVMVAEGEWDLVFLDVGLPGMDGVAFCRPLREVSRVPILFLSAYAEEDDRVRGLLAGGDDYIPKPYSLRELELRIRLRIERRLQIETADVLTFGGLEIDLGLREVRFQGVAVREFSSLEFDLLAYLAQHPGQVFSYEQLYDRVWKAPLNRGVHNLQACMARVRQRLAALCPGQQYIETIRRKGYRFTCRPAE